MSLQNLLTKLILLCIAPLVVLAVYLTVTQVQTLDADRDLEATQRARNLATAIDQYIGARVGALQMLAASPLASDAQRQKEFRQEAQAFLHNFDSHIVVIDHQQHTVLTTRPGKSGAEPALPPAVGAAALAAVERAAPTVSTTYVDSGSAETMVAIAVPGVRDGQAEFLVAALLPTRQIQQRMAQTALPPGWSLAVLDGNGVAIVRTPAEAAPPADVDDSGRFVVNTTLAPWSVVLEIPRAVYRQPLIDAAMVLAVALVGATLIGVLGGTLASRQLSRSVNSLTARPDTAPGQCIAEISEVTEIAAARRLLDESTRRRDAAEAEIRTLNASLEQRVEQRTAELLAANRELDAFAYAVSHDLRAPLRGMNGFSQALIEDYSDQLDGEAKMYLEQIGSASRKMGQLIDGLLALSRSTRGELQREPIDLSAMAARIATDLASADPTREVNVSIEPDLSLDGDAQMIEAVMTNLLSNAFKYTGRTAAPAVRVYGQEFDGQSGICVSDNGAGFDMAHAAQLFEPFRRLHRQDEFPGIGIGLATAQRIVRRHGGELSAVSAPNAGATFCLLIPASNRSAENHHA